MIIQSLFSPQDAFLGYQGIISFLTRPCGGFIRPHIRNRPPILTETTDLVLVKATRCVSAASHLSSLYLTYRAEHLCFKSLAIFQKATRAVNLSPPAVHPGDASTTQNRLLHEYQHGIYINIFAWADHEAMGLWAQICKRPHHLSWLGARVTDLKVVMHLVVVVLCLFAVHLHLFVAILSLFLVCMS